MLTTTIAGSLPKPTWLAVPNVLYGAWRIDDATRAEAQDDAVRLALAMQSDAGIDIVTDGEQRRQHYIWGFLHGLTGFDFEHMGSRVSRGGRYVPQTPAPRIVGEVTRPASVMVEAVRFARANTDRPLKVTLPGPMTICDSTLDEHYREGEEALAMHFASLLNSEARELAAAGADVIQFDEPCFNIYIDKVGAWGIRALEKAAEDVPAKRGVHICYGYGTESVLAWKSQNTDWSHYNVTLPLLAKSSIDQVSVECAASGVDPSVLRALEGKDVLAGVIDVGTEDIEMPDIVASRIRRLLDHVPAERLQPCTDCGMVPRSRAAASGKLRALVVGTALVRAELL
nr:J213 [uncultured bacterium]